MAGLTKARYVMIAEAIAAARAELTGGSADTNDDEVSTIDAVAVKLADTFQADNPDFRRGWFLAIAGAVYCEACGDRLDSYGRSATFLNTPNEHAQNGDVCACTQSGKHVPSEPL